MDVTALLRSPLHETKVPTVPPFMKDTYSSEVRHGTQCEVSKHITRLVGG
jgi:hypothetical protein